MIAKVMNLKGVNRMRRRTGMLYDVFGSVSAGADLGGGHEVIVNAR